MTRYDDLDFDMQFSENTSTRRRYKNFIMGPIPVELLQAVNETGPEACAAIIPILQHYGFPGNYGKPMKLYRDRGCEIAGCDWTTLQKGLDELEQAELVRVKKVNDYRYDVELLERDEWCDF